MQADHGGHKEAVQNHLKRSNDLLQLFPLAFPGKQGSLQKKFPKQDCYGIYKDHNPGLLNGNAFQHNDDKDGDRDRQICARN